MIVRKALAWGMTALAAVAFGSCLGCAAGTAPSTGDDPEAAHLGKVGAWAGEYAKAHNSEAPKTIDALKSWAKEKKGATDEDFVSTRDQKQYVLKVLQSGAAGTCIIYEQDGEHHGPTQLVYRVAQGGTEAEKTDMMSINMMGSTAPPDADKPQMGGPGGGPGGGGEFHPGNPSGQGTTPGH